MELVVWAGFGAFVSCLARFFIRLHEEEVSRLLDRSTESRPTPDAGPNTTHATEAKTETGIPRSHPSRSANDKRTNKIYDTRPQAKTPDWDWK
jgi:hypothetical protein